MIKNEQQLASAQTRLETLQKEAEATEDALSRFSLLDLAQETLSDIEEYELISSGQLSLFGVKSLDDIPGALIRARIARGLSHGELAERLQVHEQQVQRDESGGYERAALWRLAEVCDALEYVFEGKLGPAEKRLPDIPGTEVGADDQGSIAIIAGELHTVMMQKTLPSILHMGDASTTGHLTVYGREEPHGVH